MGGPREAVWHAIIRKNHGCTHLVVGRDHAGPGSDSAGNPFYGPYQAQELLAEHQAELGIGIVDFKMMVFAPEHDEYFPEDEIPAETKTVSISGTELRQRLVTGAEIPGWFTYPEVVAELRRTHPPKTEQGFSVFFTGLSGSGKSTIANALLVKLLELGGRAVSLLDGDLVRKNLSSELGFSKEHRDLNIRRIGYVASEITKAGGIAICAPIAPYDETRKAVRAMVDSTGGFILVHVDTPIDICEKRDRKGLYAKARLGLIPEFTGVSDPYEEPEDAEIVIHTEETSADEGAERLSVIYNESGTCPSTRIARNSFELGGVVLARSHSGDSDGSDQRPRFACFGHGSRNGCSACGRHRDAESGPRWILQPGTNYGRSPVRSGSGR
jgi:sulfate adenylyltransferase